MGQSLPAHPGEGVAGHGVNDICWSAPVVLGGRSPVCGLIVRADASGAHLVDPLGTFQQAIYARRVVDMVEHESDEAIDASTPGP